MMQLKLFFLSIVLTVSSHTAASEVSMAFGAIPPFIFPNGESGIEIEIVREALAHRGHKLKPVILPMARLPVAYLSKKVDSIMLDVGSRVSPQDGYYSDPPILYQNVFITLKKRNLSISKPDDLDKLSITSYPGASTRYPGWLEKPINAGTYKELNDQALQVVQLMRGRTDVVLSDHYIFKYYFLQKHHNTKERFSDFTLHDVLKENILNYRSVFRSKQIRDDFNSGLQHIKNNGRYRAIFDKYLME